METISVHSFGSGHLEADVPLQLRTKHASVLAAACGQGPDFINHMTCTSPPQLTKHTEKAIDFLLTRCRLAKVSNGFKKGTTVRLLTCIWHESAHNGQLRSAIVVFNHQTGFATSRDNLSRDQAAFAHLIVPFLDLKSLRNGVLRFAERVRSTRGLSPVRRAAL